jgi:hypothetical protein
MVGFGGGATTGATTGATGCVTEVLPVLELTGARCSAWLIGPSSPCRLRTWGGMPRQRTSRKGDAMDSQRFDELSSAVAQGQTRRSALRIFGAAALGALGISALAIDGADARRRGKGKGRGKGTGNARCLKSGASCETDNQCCTDNGLICEVPQNASNSDTECCGATGATCGGVNEDGDFLEPYCCIGEAGVRAFVCSESDPSNPFVRGTCLPAPDDL